MTWERFTEMSRDEFVPLVERDWLAQEFLSLMQKIDTVTEITRMLCERAMFSPEHVSLDQARVTWYLSILRKDIHKLWKPPLIGHWLSCRLIPGEGRSS